MFKASKKAKTCKKVVNAEDIIDQNEFVSIIQMDFLIE